VYILTCNCLAPVQSRPVARGGAGRGRSPPKKFFVPLEKCVGYSLKILDTAKKKLGPSQKTLRPSWCPKLVTGLVRRRISLTHTFLGRDILAGLEVASGIKSQSLMLLASHTVFYIWFALCAELSTMEFSSCWAVDTNDSPDCSFLYC